MQAQKKLAVFPSPVCKHVCHHLGLSGSPKKPNPLLNGHSKITILGLSSWKGFQKQGTLAIFTPLFLLEWKPPVMHVHIHNINTADKLPICKLTSPPWQVCVVSVYVHSMNTANLGFLCVKAQTPHFILQLLGKFRLTSSAIHCMVKTRAFGGACPLQVILNAGCNFSCRGHLQLEVVTLEWFFPELRTSS